MKNIQIKDIENLNEIIETLKKDDYVNVSLENGQKFIAISDSEFEDYRFIKELMDESERLSVNNSDSNIKIITNNGPISDNLSVEQYEFIKKQINQAIEKTLKPKPEKLN